jgi:hypothetical protein
MKKSAAAKLELFLATARKYLGYQSELLGRNIFGNKRGYDSRPWSGAFVDIVAAEAGISIPSFTYTPNGLAESIRSGNISRTPRPGDIAIFSFSSTSHEGLAASSFDMPAAGIVTDVRELRKSGRFLTIEGNTTGQSPYQNKDGVHQRIRHLTDVVLFCRPAEFQGAAASFPFRLFTKLSEKFAGLHPDRIELDGLQELTKETVLVKLAALKTGTRNRSIEVVQLALSRVTDIKGAERGKWDSATASAFARYQRSIGKVGTDAQGTVDLVSLQKLSEETGLFKVAV